MITTLQEILYFLGRGFCHQYVERSLEVGGLYFAVCARDTGLYLGFIVTVAILLVMTAGRKTKPAAMPPGWAVATSIVLLMPLVADGLSSYAGLRETTNLIRYITGYLFGTGVAILASGGIMNLWTQADRTLNLIDRPGRLILPLAASAVAGALFYLVYPFLGVAAPFISLCSLWLSVAVLILLVVSTTPLWRSAGSVAGAKRCLVLAVLCLPAALGVMALLSLLASTLGVLFPWYVHP